MRRKNRERAKDLKGLFSPEKANILFKTGIDKRFSTPFLSMEYSVQPDRNELEESRRAVKNILESYSHTLDLENVEVTLGWQKMDRESSVMHDGEKNLIVTINPDREKEEVERNVLRGLLELEFLEKADYENYDFNWQEVLKLAYVTNRVDKLMDTDVEREAELEDKWPEFRQILSQETGEFDEEFYLNAVVLGEAIGQELLEKHDLEEFPKLKRSDVIEAGERLFD